jgi:hypothetical protein
MDQQIVNQTPYRWQHSSRRRIQAGVIVSDYATLMVEILRDNARPEASEVYGAMDMP